ncbi:MAG: Gfo/Idh/MocA family oxidoreductase [Chloroflexota bacterium]
MAERIGIGFVGLGGIARDRHVPGFRAIPGVEIAAIATSSLPSAERTAAELGIPRAHADWRAVIEDPAVDAVVCAAWPDLHAPVVLAALDAGKHVLTQARLAMDAPRAVEMLRASRAHPGQVAMVVPSPMSLGADAAIARLLADGALGPVRMARAVYSGGVVGSDPWRRLRRHSGNNTMSLGIQYEAFLRWLPAATAVSAVASIAIPTMPDPRGGDPIAVDVPDHLSVVAELPGPAILTMELSATRRAEPNAAWLYGTEGTLRLDWETGALEIAEPGGAWAPVELRPGEAGGWRVEQDFIDAIRLGTPVTRTDFATGVRYMAFTDAVVEAARTGARVPVVEPVA